MITPNIIYKEVLSRRSWWTKFEQLPNGKFCQTDIFNTTWIFFIYMNNYVNFIFTHVTCTMVEKIKKP
jgi:hypothetical protein